MNSLSQSTIASATLLLLPTLILNINPISYAFLILGLSLITSFFMFNISMVSWAPLVLIIVFSSGIMTLFIYVTSLVPNENSNSNNIPLIIWIPTLILSLSPSNTSLNQSNQSINTFSHQTLLILITAILIVTLLAISLQSFNPQQSISSTF